MPLTLVLGPANSAKAGEVLGAHAAEARRDALLVVPTAADAVHYDRELAGSGVAFGRTLTFDGLLEEIARRTDYERPRMDPLARDLIVRRTLATMPVSALGGAAAAPGFPAAIGRLLGTLAAQRVTPQRLSAALAARDGDPVGADLAAILGRLARALAADGRADRDTHAWGALDALGAAPASWGETAVFLYGFDDLTRLETEAVETLARRVGISVTVAFTYEAGRPALAARAQVVERLRPVADRVRELGAQASFYAASELHHLERHLFEPDVAPMAATGALTLLEAGGERAEAELVAAEVLDALRAGVPAEEIVVVCRSLARSGARLEAALARYGVQSTSSRRIPLTHSALGRGVAALLAGDALVFLRLTRPAGEVDALEAEARRHGGRVQAPLPDLETGIDRLLPVAGPTGFSAEEERDLRAAATLRAALAELGPLSPEELATLVASLEVPAGGPGGVLVAEPLSIRARRFRRVVVTGLCEGEFPHSDPPDPLISETRRRELATDAGLVLEPAPDPVLRERYLFYASLSRASEAVSVSFRSSDEDGNAVSPSPFLDELHRLFSDLPRRRRLLADVVWTLQQAPTRREFELALAAQAPWGAAAGATGGSPPPTGAAETRRLGRAALDHVRHVRRVSPGAMERFARCPVAWLVERQLDPAGLEPEADPLVKGTLMHDLLRRVLAGEAGVLEHVPVPSELAPGRPEAVREAILAGIVAELARYLRWEDAHSAAGFAPAELEFFFETDLAGLTVSGVIDRVDVDAHGRAIVRDYKSGQDRIDRSARNWIEEHALQVGVYMIAAAQVLSVQPVAGIYQPLAGRDLRPRGAALAEVDLPLRPGDRLEPEALEKLLGEIRAEVGRLAATLRAGELTPCPAACSPDGCRYPGLCWANR